MTPAWRALRSLVVAACASRAASRGVGRSEPAEDVCHAGGSGERARRRRESGRHARRCSPMLGPDAKAIFTPATRSPTRQPRALREILRRSEQAREVRRFDKVVLSIGQGRVAVPDPDREGRGRLALRHEGGQGGDSQPPHRAQRVLRDAGRACVRGRAARVLPAQSAEGQAAAVRAEDSRAPRANATASTTRRKRANSRARWARSSTAPAAGYKKGESGKPAPYHGYHYRILKAQGPDAPGGAYDYVAQGKMIGGLALVAYPATYDLRAS